MSTSASADAAYTDPVEMPLSVRSMNLVISEAEVRAAQALVVD
jgi:hypothetical protein